MLVIFTIEGKLHSVSVPSGLAGPTEMENSSSHCYLAAREVMSTSLLCVHTQLLVDWEVEKDEIRTFPSVHVFGLCSLQSDG